jgi:hypothetical protein
MSVRLDDGMDFGEVFFLLAIIHPDQGDGWNVRPTGWSQNNNKNRKHIKIKK